MPHRVERINQLIRKELSELLERQVKDPRLGNFVSVNEVSTSPDLKRAKVFVSTFDNNVERERVLNGLKAASGFFRSELGNRLKLRYAPELNFSWDDSIERGAHLNQLIDRVVTEGNR